LIRLVASHPEWALGFQDEVWWSRLARPSLRAWAEEDRPLRLVELTVEKVDPDPKAVACYGLLLRGGAADGAADAMWLRFVDGRPVSALTTPFLSWCCERLEAAGKTALLLVWDNAPWHVSQEVRRWIRQHNRAVKRAGKGVRIVVCFLPIKSPWLNAIEAKWTHGKKRVVEAARLLTARELAERVCAAYGCGYEAHLSLPEKVA
jgi:transposase